MTTTTISNIEDASCIANGAGRNVKIKSVELIKVNLKTEILKTTKTNSIELLAEIILGYATDYEIKSQMGFMVNNKNSSVCFSDANIKNTITNANFDIAVSSSSSNDARDRIDLLLTNSALETEIEDADGCGVAHFSDGYLVFGDELFAQDIEFHLIQSINSNSEFIDLFKQIEQQVKSKAVLFLGL